MAAAQRQARAAGLLVARNPQFPSGKNLCCRGQIALTGEKKPNTIPTANDESTKVLPRIEKNSRMCEYSRKTN